MKLKIIVMLAGLSIPSSMAFAQYAEDALRFSQTEQGATARFRALGNAQTALGGDISSLSGNPAGLGLYTRSEFTFTPELNNSKTNSVYFNTASSVQKDKAGINQLGIVFNAPQKKLKGQDTKQGLLSINFGASYNKTNNHNYVVSYEGQNPTSSFADYIASLADGFLGNGNPETNKSALPSGSLEKMGYNNYLIEYNSGGYFAATEVNNMQKNTTYYSGSQSETNLGLGLNFSNQFYIGASMAFTSLNFTADREYAESGNNRTFPGQDASFTGGKYKLDYNSGQETKGSGINLKLGFIYRPNPAVRIGGSFISPTWYSITDNYSEDLNTAYTRSDGSAILPAYTNKGELYTTDYSLRTPYKLNGGVAFIVGKYGLISGDVEYVDYSSIHFSSSDYDTNLERKNNRDIRNNYQGAVNLKAGAELKLSPIALRLGINNTGNPYKDADFTSNTYSAGIGYRVNNFYIDLTYANRVTEYSNRPYKIAETYADYQYTGAGEFASVKDSRNNFFATVGFRF